MRAGPLYLTPWLDIPQFGVDSNVFNEAVDPDSDFTAQIQPQVQGWLRMGRARVSFGQLANLMYFQTFASERAVNTTSTVRVDVPLARVTLYGGAGFVRTKDRGGPEVDVRARSIRQPLNGGVTVALTRKTVVDVGADFDEMSFEEGARFGTASLRQQLTRSTESYHVTLKHAITTLSSVWLTVRQEASRFEFSPLRDNTTLRVAPSLQFRPNALLSGSAEVGYLRLEPGDPTIRDFAGPVARVDLSYVLRGATQFSVQANRDLVPSAAEAETYFLQTGFGGSVTHRVTERWDVQAGATRLRLTYGSSGRAASTTIRPAETIASTMVGGGFHFSKRLRVGFQGQFLLRDTGVIDRTYENTRLMGSLSYRFR